MKDIRSDSAGGNVIISEDVITSIAVEAVQDVDGFAGFTTPEGRRLSGRSARRGVRLSAEEGATDIDLFIRTRIGCRITDVAERIQNAVSQAADELTSFKARTINVHVTGVDFSAPKPKNPKLG